MSLQDGSDYTTKLADLDLYASVPRCWNCAFLHAIERREGLFRRTQRQYVCGRARPDYLSGGVMYNTDAAEMRASGPCGPEGRLWRPVR